MPWAAAAYAGGQIVGGAISASSARDAQEKQEEAALNAQSQLNNALQLNTPYQNYGAGSVSKLSQLMGIGPQTANKYAGMTLATIGATGNLQPNAELYATDPAYRAAFEKVNKAARKNKGYMQNAARMPGYVDASILHRLKLDGQLQDQPVEGYGSLLKDFDQNDLKKDVVYNSGLQFGLDQGNREINSRALAMGGYDSGATLKALTRFANDYGSTKAEGAFNRYNQNKLSDYSMLMGGVGVGQQAVNQASNIYGNKANLLTGLGDAQGASEIAQGNAWSGAVSNISDMFGQSMYGGSARGASSIKPGQMSTW